jgi:hypothetical protein
MPKTMEQVIAEQVRAVLAANGAAPAAPAAPATALPAKGAAFVVTVDKAHATAAGFNVKGTDAEGRVVNLYVMRKDTAQAKRILRG